MEGLAGAVAFRDREDWQFRCSLEGDSHSGRLLDSANKLRTSIAALALGVGDEHQDLPCGFGRTVDSDESGK